MVLKRFEENPILKPTQNPWENFRVFNPAVVYEDGKFHIVYRAMSSNRVSVLGYASSKDGFHIDERLEEPIYTPRKDFERKKGKGNSGCEDPRITKIRDKFYMCYTAVDGKNPTRVALTSIKVKDFLNYKWKWEEPILISPPGIDDKNACILPEKINKKYVIFHRIYPCIWIDFVESLVFGENTWIKGSSWFKPRTNRWDSRKIGIGAPPVKTKAGWLLIYHGVSEKDRKYRAGVMLLDLENPTKLISRSKYPILEPEKDYEKNEKKVVFPCGAVVVKKKLFIYYGGGDKVVGVATADLDKLIEKLL